MTVEEFNFPRNPLSISGSSVNASIRPKFTAAVVFTKFARMGCCFTESSFNKMDIDQMRVKESAQHAARPKI